jgi:hypothetical protein
MSISKTYKKENVRKLNIYESFWEKVNQDHSSWSLGSASTVV